MPSLPGALNIPASKGTSLLCPARKWVNYPGNLTVIPHSFSAIHGTFVHCSSGRRVDPCTSPVFPSLFPEELKKTCHFQSPWGPVDAPLCLLLPFLCWLLHKNDVDFWMFFIQVTHWAELLADCIFTFYEPGFHYCAESLLPSLVPVQRSYMFSKVRLLFHSTRSTLHSETA